MRLGLRRREFIAGLSGAAAWPLAARLRPPSQAAKPRETAGGAVWSTEFFCDSANQMPSLEQLRLVEFTFATGGNDENCQPNNGTAHFRCIRHPCFCRKQGAHSGC